MVGLSLYHNVAPWPDLFPPFVLYIVQGHVLVDGEAHEHHILKIWKFLASDWLAFSTNDWPCPGRREGAGGHSQAGRQYPRGLQKTKNTKYNFGR